MNVLKKKTEKAEKLHVERQLEGEGSGKEKQNHRRLGFEGVLKHFLGQLLGTSWYFMQSGALEEVDE